MFCLLSSTSKVLYSICPFACSHLSFIFVPTALTRASFSGRLLYRPGPNCSSSNSNSNPYLFRFPTAPAFVRTLVYAYSCTALTNFERHSCTVPIDFVASSHAKFKKSPFFKYRGELSYPLVQQLLSPNLWNGYEFLLHSPLPTPAPSLPCPLLMIHCIKALSHLQ
jgi:hypothetical protein